MTAEPENTEENAAVVASETTAEETATKGIPVPNDTRLLNKYGFDIKYDAESDSFTLAQTAYRYLEIKEDGKRSYLYSWDKLDTDTNDNIYYVGDEISYHPIQREYFYDYSKYYNELLLEDRLERFGVLNQNNTMISVQIVKDDYYEWLNAEDETETVYDGIGGSSSVSTGNIKIRVPTISSENYDKYIAEYNPTPEELENNKKFFDEKNNFARIQSISVHEMSHTFTDRYGGTSQYDLPPQYMSKLNMLNEIKSNMAEAGLALDVYKATGNLEYFDKLGIDMSEVKDKLQQNPQMENPEGYVATYVYEQWLKKNNRPGTTYSEQAKSRGRTLTMFALDGTQDSLNRYHERVAAMFEYVEGLGDVRQYVNPDFELNEDLQKSLLSPAYELNKSDKDKKKDAPVVGNSNLKAVMMHNANNAERYSKNLMAYLELVMQVDKDGYRTDEENALLSAYLEEHGASQNNPATQEELTNNYYAGINTDIKTNEHLTSASMNDLKALLRIGVDNAEGYYQNLRDYMALSRQLDTAGVSAEEKASQLRAFMAERFPPAPKNDVVQTSQQNTDVAQADTVAVNPVLMHAKLNQKINH